jgi:hypothetical protein
MKMIAAVASAACLLVACGMVDSEPTDLCNDEAQDSCFQFLRQCGLTGSEAEPILDECKPWLRCKQAAFDDCRDRHTG